MTREERETHINHEVGAGVLHVYSTERAVWNRCERLGLELIESTRIASGVEIARQYSGDSKKYYFLLRQRSSRGSEAAKRRISSGLLPGRKKD